MLQLVKYVMKLHDKGAKVGTEVAALFGGELNPVARKAQKKVPVPEGSVLHLEFCINLVRNSFNLPHIPTMYVGSVPGKTVDKETFSG